MFSASAIFVICCCYMAVLSAIAIWVERKAAKGRDIGNNPIIYALSLTVYLTAWTFYGSVGKAASTGMLFTTFYIGPTIGMFLWWIIVRRMVRIKNSSHVTSIADFISLRYNKSLAIAALVTIISILGIVPYLALQFKAIIGTFKIITQRADGTITSWFQQDIAFVLVGMVAIFTIILGVRRVVPTERHQGVVAVLVAESIIKLVALVAVGLFIVYSMFNGFGDIFGRFAESLQCKAIREVQASPQFYVSWFTHLLLSMSAFLFLPWQFHVAVVENFHEKHIRTAMWLCPLYMLLIAFCILPIAMGGLLRGNPASLADTFVLLLPHSSGQAWLSLLAFLGGFSASIGMIMICLMTISTMATNHLLLPVIEYAPGLKLLKRYILQCRWLTVAFLTLAAFWFEQRIGTFATLVDVGMMAFVAVLQFAPAAIGGLFWKKGHRIGAFAAMTGGALVWAYTLILPAFIKGGFAPYSILIDGPWGIATLRPECLLGATGFDPVSHAVLWTMLVNIGLYVTGSLCVKQTMQEENVSEAFVTPIEGDATLELAPGEAVIDLSAKCRKIEKLFCEYYSAEKAAELTRLCLTTLRIDEKSLISLVELAELQSEVEKRLAGSIGAATADQAICRAAIITPEEENTLKQMFADIVAELRLSPAEFTRKINYFREQEKTRAIQARELQKKVNERDTEIVERRRVEESLRNSEKRLTDILNLLPDATFVIDLEGRVILWNRAAEELTGVKTEDILGKGNHEHGVAFYGIRRPILIDLVFSPSHEIESKYPHIERRGTTLFGEAYSQNMRDTEIYMLGVASPLYDSEGNVVGAIECVRDISDRKHSEEELKKHRDHLEELVKERTAELSLAKEAADAANRAKSNFLANMSHEIRTPMTAILGYADILLGNAKSPKDIDSINTIKRNGDHLLTVINDILDLSRIEAGKDNIEQLPCSPIAVVAETESLMRVRTAAKKLPLEIVYYGSIPEIVHTDPVRLRQILINLVGNAVKFTEAGCIQMAVHLTIPSPNSPPLLQFDVSDSGMGISKEQIDRLFQPFTQADESITRIFGGTGLGLAISKRLANKLGGDLVVTSAVGSGSTFSLTIDPGPLDGVEFVQNPNQVVPTDKSEAELTTKVTFKPNSRILLAEDGLDNQRLLTYFLNKAGAEVMIADNGEIALNKVAASMKGLTRREGDPSGPFDLVLMDMQMPVMDGYEATRQLRQAGFTGPILALTAHAMKEDRQKCMDAGCDDHISKPIKRDAFLRTVAHYLAEAEQSHRKESAEQA